MIKALAALLVTLPLLAATAGPADLEPAEELVSTVAFTDPAGDANFVNDQGTGAVPIDDAGPDTRPASVDSADLVEGRWETDYVSAPEHDADGRIVAVRRVPIALRLHLRTAAPAIPSFGPTVALDLWAEVEGCPVLIRLWARGWLSGPDDPEQGPELRTRSEECPGGVTTYTEGLRVDPRGQVTVLDLPFDALGTAAGPVLEPGDVLAPDPSGLAARSEVHQGLSGGLLPAGPNTVDKVAVIEPFVIASDLPPDVDCIEAPGHPECAPADAPPDTGLDLHAVMLDSEPPGGSAPGAAVSVAEEFGVFSFRPDGRWVTFGPFDVAAAGFTEEWVRIDLAGRLMENGEVSDDSPPLAEAFTNWKLLYGPADDPYRNIAGVLSPAPWGTTVSLPAEDVERVTILLGSEVRGHHSAAVAVGISGSATGTIAIPFPGAFAMWMDEWSDGKRKVRLVEDHWGHGAQVAVWGFGPSFSSDHRRGLTVEEGRPRAFDVAGPGTLRVSGDLATDGPALSTALLFYQASGAQTVDLEWRIPAETRRVSGLGEALLLGRATDGGPGTYAVDIEVQTATEASRLVSYTHDLWALDPVEVFPGLRAAFTSDPPAEALVLGPGDIVEGPAPPLILTFPPGPAR